MRCVIKRERTISQFVILENKLTKYSIGFDILFVCYFELWECLLTGCHNGGHCVADEMKQTFSCLCQVPWAGEKCDIKIGKIIMLNLY